MPVRTCVRVVVDTVSVQMQRRCAGATHARYRSRAAPASPRAHDPLSTDRVDRRRNGKTHLLRPPPRRPRDSRTPGVAISLVSAVSHAWVQNGYVSSSTGGHARPVQEPKNRLISSENVPARAREWTRVPHLSFPRNEGVPGSSPGVGLNPCSEALFGAAEHFHTQ